MKKLLYMLMFMYYFAGAIMFPYFSLYLSGIIKPYEIGILMSILPTAMLILQPFWGWAADRFGIKRILVITLSMTSISVIGFTQAKTFAAFFIALSVYSVFAAAICSLIDSIILAEDANNYGKIRLWGTIGYGIGAFVGGLFKSQLLGFWSFIIHMVLYIACCITIFIFPVKKPLRMVIKKEEGKQNRFSIIFNPTFLILLISLFMTGSMIKGYDNFFAIGLTNLKIPGILLGSIWLISMFPEMAMFSKLDKISLKLSPWLIIISGTILYCARMFFLGFFPTLWVWVVTQPILGVAYSLWYFGAIRIIKQMVGENQQATGQAVFWAASYGAGGLAGSNLSGLLVDNFGVFYYFKIATFVLLLSATILVTLFLRIRKAKVFTKNSQITSL